MNIAVLGSTRGTDLQAIIEAMEKGELPGVEISFVLSNKKDAQILERGCKITGCTLMFIDEGADTGPIILQKAVDVADNETVDSLKEKVQKAEGEALLEGIKLYRDGRIKVEGKKVLIKQ